MVKATESRKIHRTAQCIGRTKKSIGQNARFEEEQESLLNQAENLNKEKTEVQLEIDRLKAQQKELNEKVQYLESQLYVTDEQHDEKLETIKDEYYQLMSEQSDVNNDIRFLEHTIQENESKQSRLDSRLVEAYEQLKHIQSDINEAEKQSTTTKKELKNAEQQLNEYERKLTQLKQQRSDMKKITSSISF